MYMPLQLMNDGGVSGQKRSKAKSIRMSARDDEDWGISSVKSWGKLAVGGKSLAETRRRRGRRPAQSCTYHQRKLQGMIAKLCGYHRRGKGLVTDNGGAKMKAMVIDRQMDRSSGGP